MKKNNKNIVAITIMAIILIIIFCISITPITLQNDTFYTIKIGEHINNNGIKVGPDIFSWHENIEYTFPHWLYDLIIFKIFETGGMTGIYISTIVLASILGLAIYFTNVKLVGNRILSFALTIITLYLLKPYICARAQLVTFILFIITIYFIERFLDTKKLRYAIGLIVIPILIANIHLATFPFYFVLYLPYLAEYVAYILAYSTVIISQAEIDSITKKIKKAGETPELLEKLEKAKKRNKKLQEKQDDKIENPYKIKITYKENTKYLVIIFIICLFTGLLTPLGSTPYTYLIKTMQGISTKNISEHLPVVLAQNSKLLMVIATFIAVLMLTRTKVRLCDLCMVAGLTLLTIFSRRQASMLYLVGVVILNRLISYIVINYKQGSMEKLEKYLSKAIAIVIITMIVCTISILQYRKKINNQYIDEKTYPVAAAQWIKENLDINEIKLFNQYNYGSYLIYENIPVFVDSRCDLYMPEFNKDVHVFEDFLKLNDVKISKMKEKIDEYQFTHFIVTNGSRIKTYLDERPKEYRKIYPIGEIKDDNFTIYEKIK